MAAHRYWRLLVDESNGSAYVSIIELELLDSGDDNVATGGTASASSTGFGWSASNAFNGDFAGGSTGWHSGTGALNGTDEWLKYDLGSGNEKDVVACSITNRASNDTQAPKVFKIQYSDDDSAWSDLLSVSGETWTATSETRIYTTLSLTNELPARYWRVYITEDGSAENPACAELELRESVGGSDTTGGATATSSSQYSDTYSAAKAIDNDVDTLWLSNPLNGVPAWIQCDYGSASKKTIVEMAYKYRNDGISRQWPKTFYLQYRSRRANSWSTQFSVSNESTWGNGEQRAFPTNASRTSDFFFLM